MEERRKRAYRYLLYQAMIDIRPVAWALRRTLNPFVWKRQAAQVQRAGVIADWLHNLALYSALDFERFEEDRFWETLRYYERRHPDFHLVHYMDLFERELSREEGGQGK